MSEIKSTLFTIGKFASMHDINKKTLMWYDQMDLFKPVVVKENGYRYYSYQQSSTLETILMLRELNVSIKEIKTFIEHKSEEALKTLLNEKIKELSNTIQHMCKIKDAMSEKCNELEELMKIDVHSITVIEKKEQPLLTIKIKEDTSIEKEIEQLFEETKKHQISRIYHMKYGSILGVDKLYKYKFDDYEAISIYVNKEDFQENNHICPKGLYLRAYCKGDWGNLRKRYLELLDYAKEHNYVFYGYAYETGINENVINSMEDYITMIEIPIKERKKDE